MKSKNILTINFNKSKNCTQYKEILIMIPDKKYISELIKDRAKYARIIDLKESRTIYNPLIKHHIKGFKNQLHTIKEIFN